MTCHLWPEGQPEIELPKPRAPRLRGLLSLAFFAVLFYGTWFL